jgi:hypothetical protein
VGGGGSKIGGVVYRSCLCDGFLCLLKQHGTTSTLNPDADHVYLCVVGSFAAAPALHSAGIREAWRLDAGNFTNCGADECFLDFSTPAVRSAMLWVSVWWFQTPPANSWP